MLQAVKALAEAYTASCSIGTGFLSQGQSGRGMKLIKLRMNGALPIVLLYTFMTWTRTDLYLPSQKICISKSQSGYCSSVDKMAAL